MALSTDKKLYIAVGTLVVLGGVLYVQNKKQAEEQATYTLSGKTADLPKLEITDEDIKKIDKIQIQQPAGDAGKPTEVVLRKEGEDWELETPMKAKANQANVKSLLDNLKTLSPTELINPDKASYGSYDLADDKAVHATFYAGDKAAHEFYFGQSGGRGQMARLAGKEGVYALKGYSSYLYARDTKGWRDMNLLKLDDKKVKSVEVENETGTFSFTAEASAAPAESDKDAGAAAQKTWKATLKRAGGGLGPIARFESKKVDDLIRAYKSLNATDFSREKTAADVGLEKPSATVTFEMEDGAKHVLKVGDKADSGRWVTLGDKTDELFVISTWAADWATAKEEKFQKPEEKKDAGAPGDMGQMGQMGHGDMGHGDMGQMGLSEDEDDVGEE